MKVPDEVNPGKNGQVQFKIQEFFWLQVEVDKKLMPLLTGSEHRGALKLGASPINLIVGGIVLETKKQIEKDLIQQPDDLVLNLSGDKPSG